MLLAIQLVVRSPSLPETALRTGNRGPRILRSRSLLRRSQLWNLIGIDLMQVLRGACDAHQRVFQQELVLTPNLARMLVSGHIFVKPLWKRFSPTKAVNPKK